MPEELHQTRTRRGGCGQLQSDREQSMQPTNLNDQMLTDPPIDYIANSNLPERREPQSPNSNHWPAARQCTPVVLPALLIISIRQNADAAI